MHIMLKECWKVAILVHFNSRVAFRSTTERRKRQRQEDGAARRRNWQEKFGDSGVRETSNPYRDTPPYRDNNTEPVHNTKPGLTPLCFVLTWHVAWVTTNCAFSSLPFPFFRQNCHLFVQSTVLQRTLFIFQVGTAAEVLRRRIVWSCYSQQSQWITPATTRSSRISRTLVE